MENLTWRDVFDSYKPGHIRHIYDLLNLLKTTGYEYFDWNGRIYKAIENYTKVEDTGLTFEDLNKNTPSKQAFLDV